jgi:adenosylmethionine-8-amino-7-oxononanoate aminotransferase
MQVSHDSLQRAASEHLLLHFARNGSYGPGRAPLLVLERGEGPYVFDTQGKRYVDGLSSLFCAQIGYSYGSEMGEAAACQLERLPFNTNWGTAHPPAIELAGRLAELAPSGLEKVFFTSGGSEAVEAAWKIARQYHIANGEPQRHTAIARRFAYHGATLGALSFTGVQSMKEPFGPPPIPVRRVSNTNSYRTPEGDDEYALCARLLDEVERTILAEGAETIALVIAEPVQNAGGCLTAPAGYWRGLRELCARYGILLVADEVITAFGRLGEWFGVSTQGISPDIITVAKGLTSAYAPMGAVLVADQVAAPLYDDGATLLHGITFGGHPLSAAIALKNIEIFERDGILENVRGLEDHLKTRLDELRAIPTVGDVRGAGFFWAVELVRDRRGQRFDAEGRQRLVREFLPARLLEAGVIARADDRGDVVVQIAPPLISDASVLDEIVDALADVLTHASELIGIGAASATMT